MVMISLAAGVIAKKFFGKQRSDADDDVQGDHPIVRAIFQAINTGEDADLRDRLHPELRVYLNDYPVTDAVRAMKRDPEYVARKPAALGAYEQVTGPAAQRLYNLATDVPQSARDWVRTWLRDEFRVNLEA